MADGQFYTQLKNGVTLEKVASFDRLIFRIPTRVNPIKIFSCLNFPKAWKQNFRTPCHKDTIFDLTH